MSWVVLQSYKIKLVYQVNPHRVNRVTCRCLSRCKVILVERSCTLTMGKLLSLLARDESTCCTPQKYDVFLDFESKCCISLLFPFFTRWALTLIRGIFSRALCFAALSLIKCRSRRTLSSRVIYKFCVTKKLVSNAGESDRHVPACFMTLFLIKYPSNYPLR